MRTCCRLIFHSISPPSFQRKRTNAIYDCILLRFDYDPFHKRLYKFIHIDFCFLLHSSKATNKRMKKIYIAMIIGTVFFMSTTELGSEFLNTVVFHKIYANGQLDFSLSSGGARTISISSVLSTIYHHPITLVGVGYDELRNMGVEGCAGFLFLLLAIGIMPFSILFGFCFYQVFKYNKGIWDIIVRILLVINMGLGQPHIINFALFTMMLYPYFIVNSFKKTRISHVRSC